MLPTAYWKYAAHLWNILTDTKQQTLNLIKPLVLTANLQEREETKEYVKQRKKSDGGEIYRLEKI